MVSSFDEGLLRITRTYAPLFTSAFGVCAVLFLMRYRRGMALYHEVRVFDVLYLIMATIGGIHVGYLLTTHAWVVNYFTTVAIASYISAFVTAICVGATPSSVL
jgi:hypothetical protein